MKTYAHRFSVLAKELADKAEGTRKDELLEISRICDKVPYEPAETFYEAIQSTWFIQLILQIESNGHSLSYGRFDQYVYPFLQHDLDKGIITEDQAVELLTNLWIKTLTINKVRSQAHTFSSAGSPMYQNVTIGGQTSDKKCAVNKLSYLVLRSVAQTRLPQPNLTVRYYNGMPQEFLDEAVEVMKLGTGMPAFNNDEIIIPSFIDLGVKEEDAYNYSAIGCVETAVPGKWGYRCTGMSYLNFPRILLCVMNDGIDLTTGKRFVEGSGHFKDMKSFEELQAAWDKAIKELTRVSVIVENAVDLAGEREIPDILCSALTQDCIGRGKTIKEGGAIYDFISGLQIGIANMADSLAAIKKLVYEEKKITDTSQEIQEKIELNKLGEEDTIIEITVTAEKQEIQKTYKIHIKRPYGKIKGKIQLGNGLKESMDGSYGITMNYVADLRIYKQDQINWDDIIQGNLSLDDVDSEQTEKTTKSDDEGNYEIYVIPGKYDFYAERQGFLADITTKITINENDEIDLGTKILYEGDADRSGIIDLNDTIEIVNSMGASKGDSTYSEKYDFGQKGYVSLDNMVSVVGNLYKTITIEEHTG